MGTIFDNAKTIQEKRDILKTLSKPLQELAKSDAIESVNEGLKDYYRQDGHHILKTIHQWNKEGKRIKKGEHALCLWGRPKKREEHNNTAVNGTEEDNPLNFFPICYVFSNRQLQ